MQPKNDTTNVMQPISGGRIDRSDPKDKILIDLNILKGKKGAVLDECTFNKLGAAIEMILRQLISGEPSHVDITISGTKPQIQSFWDACKQEEKYLRAMQASGDGHPVTFAKKNQLDNAIKKFTSLTDLKWPFN